MAELSPREPPLLCADLPPVGGRIGPDPEDFRVDELPLWVASGAGDQLLVRLEKRAFTTEAAVRAIARAANVDPRAVGTAGMKDKHAVTTQWLTLPATGRDPATWRLPPGLTVTDVGRHDRKLRTGQLAGNAFRIRLVDVEPDAAARAAEILARVTAHGLPNFFGAQRFGLDGGNVDQAVRWVRAGLPDAGPKARFLRKLYPSVIQSEVFNRYLLRRQLEGLEEPRLGELVRRPGALETERVGDVGRAREALASGQLVLTGPIPGPKMARPAGIAAQWEAEAISSLPLSAAEWKALGAHGAGTRRDLVAQVAAVRVEPEPGALRVSFALPPGAYATQLLRELTRAPFLERRGVAGPPSDGAPPR